MVNKSKSPIKPPELELQRDQRHYPEHGTVVFEETRGARTRETMFLFSEYEETFSNEDASADRPYLEMRQSAQQWVGKATNLQIETVKSESRPSGSGKRSSKRAERSAIRRWSFEIGMDKGFLSPAGIAANFIASAERVQDLAGGNSKLLTAIYQFADAWHWMHFERSGEHRLAAKGLEGPVGLKRGPEAKRLKASIKDDIIRQELDKIVRTPGQRAKAIAGKMIEPLNEHLEKRGLKPVTEAALVKKLPPLLKRSGRTGQFGKSG